MTAFPSSKNLRIRIVRPNPRILLPLIRHPRPLRKHWFLTVKSKVRTHAVCHYYRSFGTSRLISRILRYFPSRFPHVSHNYSHSSSRVFFFCALILRLLFPSLTRSNQQETALINSGTKARRANAHKGHVSHRCKARSNIRPEDVSFAWLKDLYTCGDNYLDGCPCEEILGVLFLPLESSPFLIHTFCSRRRA